MKSIRHGIPDSEFIVTAQYLISHHEVVQVNLIDDELSSAPKSRKTLIRLRGEHYKISSTDRAPLSSCLNFEEVESQSDREKE